jgi:hypothetical protein
LLAACPPDLQLGAAIDRDIGLEAEDVVDVEAFTEEWLVENARRPGGYWQPDLQGLEHLTRADQAELLVDYLGVSENQLVKTLERLIADGKYELAASLLESSGDRFSRSGPVAHAKRLVYLKLIEKHQNTDPFKFIIYSAKIGEQTPQMAAPK